MDNVTVIVALIAALAAIVSPLISADIQRKSALEIKQLDIIYKDKAETYKAFSAAFGKLNQNIFLDPQNDFVSISYQAMLFSNATCREEILNLIGLIDSGKEYSDNDLKNQFAECVRLLCIDLEDSNCYFY